MTPDEIDSLRARCAALEGENQRLTNRVADLLHLRTEEALSIPNFGAKSLDVLWGKVIAALLGAE